jgi:RNA polymerase sigma factor (sigma-70 family)
MTTPQADILSRHLRGLAAAAEQDRQPDQQLLERFAASHDDAAFEALVGRHGPMVLGVCRRLLGDVHEAEDAFQAAFLVLAREAGAVGKRGSVGGFMYRVAYNLALKAKASAAARQRERSTGARSSADPLTELTGRELLAVLDEEMGRLPERYRAPLVLCYLEGRTRDQAARQLGWSLGTLKRRLEQARTRLRVRLERRGVALSAALLAAALTTARLPPGLAASVARAARLVASGQAAAVSAQTAALMNKAAVEGKRKVAAAVMLTLGLVGAGWLASGTPLPGLARRAIAPQPKAAAIAGKKSGPQQQAPPKPAAEGRRELAVTGRVLDADGKPVASARVAILAGVPRLQRHGGLRLARKLLGQGQTNRDGDFRLTVPRTSSARNWAVDVVAARAGYGLGWQPFDPDAEAPAVSVRLRPEQALRGRLIDLEGQPAAGVKLRLDSVRNVSKKDGNDGSAIISLSDPRECPAFWPEPGATDKDGTFAVRGIGRDMAVTLHVHDERFAAQTLELVTDEKAARQKVTRPLMPARVLEGRVTYADTGKPAPDVEVGAWGVRGETDAEGRFRLRPAQGPIREQEETGLVLAYAPERQPYLNAQKQFRWPRAALKHRIDLALPRGVLVRGRVTEKGGGKPVADALVHYFAQHTNPNLKLEDLGGNNFANGRNAVVTDREGAFQIACLPGPGFLTVEGPSPDYVLRENGGYKRLDSGKRGGQPWWSHGFAALDLKAGARPPEVAVTLHKGITLQGEVTGPEGQAVSDLQVFCRLEGFATRPVRVRGGRFELHGCGPEGGVRVMLFDAKNRWGNTVEMSARKADGGPVRVRLRPCGSARVRFLDGEGKPLADFYPGLFLELAPKRGDLLAQTYPVASPFRKTGPHTDEQGRCTLATLIPGGTYHFGHAEIEATFRAESGAPLQLGEVVMK